MNCPTCGNALPSAGAPCPRCSATLAEVPLGETHVLGPSESEVGSGATEALAALLRDSGATPAAPSGSAADLVITSKDGQPVVFGARYEILAILGEGGMGRVYKARDRELDKIIALKTIRADKAGSPEILARFKQELILSRKVTHKNVVRIFDLGEAEGVKFFTMEYVEGESLKDLIRRRGPLPVVEAIDLARQILVALQEAHAAGVIHRDLKPQNIIVEPPGIIHVMDFGIARSTDASGITTTGMILGTPDYMSPEQAQGTTSGPGSDLFSFGVILYEMLTGDVPFKADTTAAKVFLRLTQRAAPPRQLRADIPRYLDDVVQRCMERDVALRYQSAADILRDLVRQQAGGSTTLLLRRALRNWRATTVGIAVATAAATAVAATLYLRSTSAPAPAATPPPPPAAEPVTMALVPFTNATGSADLEWLRTGLPSMVATDLGQSRYVRPVSPDRVAKVMAEAGLATQTRFDEAALDALSGRLRTQWIVSGQYVTAGERLRLDLLLRKVGSGISTPIKVEGTAGEVFTIVDGVTDALKLRLDLTEEQRRADLDRPVSAVSTGSLEALRGYRAGLENLARGANAEAAELFRKATAGDAEFAVAYAKLAEAQLNLGEGRQAAESIERARQLADRKELPLFERYQIHATAALVKEDFQGAAQAYAELIKLSPSDPDLHLALAGTYEELGRQPEAIEEYGRALDLAPGHAAALLGRARSQVRSGRYADAIAALEHALAADPSRRDPALASPETMGMLHSILGVAYRETGRFDEAVKNFEASLAQRRKAKDRRGEITTLTNLGVVYTYRGESGRALRANEQALALARAMGDAEAESDSLLEIGLLHQHAGRLDRALAALRQSARIEMSRGESANLANALNHVADVYRELGRFDDALVYLDQAKTHLDKAGSKSKETGINLVYRGQVHKAQGRYEDAVQALLAALPIFQEMQYDTGVLTTQGVLADIYRRQGRHADAMASLRQGMEIATRLKSQHDLRGIHVARARLLAAVGRSPEAEADLQEADRLSKAEHRDDPGADHHLALAEVAWARQSLEDASREAEASRAGAIRPADREVRREAEALLARVQLKAGPADAAQARAVALRRGAAAERSVPAEAEGATVLAEIQLALGRHGEARRTALDAIALADRYAGRPLLARAYAALGGALAKLGRQGEATDAYARSAAALDWMRGSVRPEDQDAFMGRADVRALLSRIGPPLQAASRSEVAPLQKWMPAPSTRSAR